MCGSIHPDAHPASRKGTPGAMKRLLSDKVLLRLVLGNLLVAGLLGLATWLSLRANHQADLEDRKSTRLNSSHLVISYAVFCLKKKKKTHSNNPLDRPKTNTKEHAHTIIVSHRFTCTLVDETK